MNIPNIRHNCEQAKLYYYDFLEKNIESEIPNRILKHISGCEYCQKQIFKLKSAISQSNKIHSFAQNKQGTPLVNLLKDHLSYVGQDITCSIVRPFLPEILDSSSIRISVPTPITAHLDHCPECVQDLRKISNLHLSEKNLHRLSQLFRAKYESDNIDCSKARAGIMAFTMLAFQELDEQTLNHLCVCKKCSSDIEKFRGSIIDLHIINNDSKPCFLSSKLSFDSIFDYVIPYGLNITQFKASEFHKSRISHIRRCPFCLEKLQEFQHTITGIFERSDSEITTKYMLESNQTVSATNTENIYAGFPVNVEVSRTNEEVTAINSDKTINFTAALKRKILASNYKSIYKTGFAGIFLIGFMLTAMFLSSRNVEADVDNLAQLNNSIKNANNIHISTYMHGQETSYQEQWISRSENMQITLTNNDKLTILDLDEKLLITGNINSKPNKIDKVTNERISDAEKYLNSSLGLTPFYSISVDKPGAKWEKLTTDSQIANSETEVYQLSYFDDTFGDPVSFKLLYTVKAVSGLPVKVEAFQKLPNEDEFSPGAWIKIEYLEDEEFNNIQESFYSN